MAGFPDLVAQAMPALVGGGTEDAGGTEGKDWKFTLTDFVDNAGTVINLSSVTGTCKVRTRASDGTLTDVITLTVAGDSSGTLTITATDAATANLAAGKIAGRKCEWSLKLSLSGDVIQVWFPDNSPFTIFRES